jgi:hypothetical protein
MPVEAQSDSLAAAVASAVSVATSAKSSSKIKKQYKVSSKELMMDLVTKIKETFRDRTSSCTTCGISTSPATKKLRTHFLHAPHSSKVFQKGRMSYHS